MAIGSVTFGGLASGLPSDLVDQLVEAEKLRSKRYESDKTFYQGQQAAFGQFEGAVLALRGSTTSLSLASTFKARTATSSDTSVLSVSASSTAVTSSVTIQVDQKAQNDLHIQDDAFGVDATSDALSTGDGTFAFDFGGTTHSFDVGVSYDTNSLGDLVDDINNADTGVTASVMNDGGATGQYRLMLTSDSSGASNVVTNITTTGLTAWTGNTFSNTEAGQDAKITIGGVGGTQVSSSTNTFDEAIKGVTMTVASSSGTVTVNVSNNADSVKNVINNFIGAYNGVVDFIRTQNNVDSPGILKADATSRSVGNHLRGLISTRVENVSGDYASLAEIGITTDYQTGRLSLDSDKLDAALAADFDGVGEIFFSDSDQSRIGLGDDLKDYLDEVTSTLGGAIATRKSGFETRIDDLDERIERENARVEAIRERLTKQYAALEQLINQFQTTGNSLVQSLSQLPSIGGNQ